MYLITATIKYECGHTYFAYFTTEIDADEVKAIIEKAKKEKCRACMARRGVIATS